MKKEQKKRVVSKYNNRSKTELHKICCVCNKEIQLNQKFVLLGTYIEKKKLKTLDEQYFHIDCFRGYIKNTIDAKIKQAQREIVKGAGMFATNIMRNLNLQ